MNLVYLAFGVFLLGVAVVDLLWTTLWVNGGAGPLTTGLMTWTWRVLRGLGQRGSQAITLSGPLILVLGLAAWITLVWLGWTFVFAAGENALIDTRDPGPVGWVERFYFVGYSVFTLGNGDFTPRDGVWQVATGVTTASGMLLVTLSVSYVISVLDAVTQKRSFASNVNGLGDGPEDVVVTGWNGSGFDGLELPLDTLASQLNELTANHQAYPVIHYFHTPESRHSPVYAVAVLDEALTIIKHGVTTDGTPPEPVVMNARRGVGDYLDTVAESFAPASNLTPPPPSLSRLGEAGIPTVGREEFVDSVGGLEDRRRRLLGLVEADERAWPGDNDR